MERLHLFEGFGIELEYMIVNGGSLDVMPVSDEVLFSVSGNYSGDAKMGEVEWSNELVMHVIELKTNGPVEKLDHLPGLFQKNVDHVNRILDGMGARLMPAAMHPWMDPFREMKLWAHEYNEVYAAFNKIFNCKGHGWANLQSMHINLPFYDDAEFARLHAAMRLVLPIMPALAASSPVMDAHSTGILDNRLAVYRTNSARVPMVAGRVIPEPAYTHGEYEDRILKPLYRDISPFDPDGILQYEWLNSRGAMARFDRGAIEIRLLDVQEHPGADLAVGAIIIAVIDALIQEFSATLESQKAWEVDPLFSILVDTIKDAEGAIISNRKYLEMFRYPEKGSCRASELWQHLAETVLTQSRFNSPQWEKPLNIILTKGTLSRRILRALGNSFSEHDLREVYGTLCDSLRDGKPFGA